MQLGVEDMIIIEWLVHPWLSVEGVIMLRGHAWVGVEDVIIIHY